MGSAHGSHGPQGAEYLFWPFPQLNKHAEYLQPEKSGAHGRLHGSVCGLITGSLCVVSRSGGEWTDVLSLLGAWEGWCSTAHLCDHTVSGCALCEVVFLISCPRLCTESQLSCRLGSASLKRYLQSSNFFFTKFIPQNVFCFFQEKLKCFSRILLADVRQPGGTVWPVAEDRRLAGARVQLEMLLPCPSDQPLCPLALCHRSIKHVNLRHFHDPGI